jgi:hypothetical protein
MGTLVKKHKYCLVEAAPLIKFKLEQYHTWFNDITKQSPDATLFCLTFGGPILPVDTDRHLTIFTKQPKSLILILKWDVWLLGWCCTVNKRATGRAAWPVTGKEQCQWLFLYLKIFLILWERSRLPVQEIVLFSFVTIHSCWRAKSGYQ